MDQLLELSKKLDNDFVVVCDDEFSPDESIKAPYILLNTGKRYLIWQNTLKCFGLLRRTKCKVVISTGAGTAIILFVLARILKIKCIYVESVARVRTLSLTGKITRYLVDHFFVQSEDLALKIGQKYEGRIHFDGL